MATNTSLKTQIEGRNTKPTFSAFMSGDNVRNTINRAVGEKDAQRFASAIISAVSVNHDLQQCEPSTILSGALLGNSLKLSPSPQLGQYYLVPFNDNKRGVKVAQFVLGYKGYIQLAIRSDYYKKLNVVAIKEGELLSYDPLTEEIEVNLIADEQEREKAITIGYYAMFEYNNGFRKAIYWSKQKMESHALKYSPGYKAKKGYTFWEKDFDSMAYKTMLRQLISKWGIMSIDLQEAVAKDMGIINENGDSDIVSTNDIEIVASVEEENSFAVDADYSEKLSEEDE